MWPLTKLLNVYYIFLWFSFRCFESKENACGTQTVTAFDF